jgi:uncharacterized membrane protein YkoI
MRLTVPSVIVCAGVIAAMGVTLLTASSIHAGDHEHDHDHEHDLVHDHDWARQALVRGEIAPLEKVLAAARSEIDGDFVGAELEIEHGAWVYDLKFIDRSGVLRKIHVNAKTAKIIIHDMHK